MRSVSAVLAVSLLTAWAEGGSAVGQAKESKQNRWVDPQMALPEDFPTEVTVLPGKRVKLGKQPFRVAPYEQRELRWGNQSLRPVRVVIVGRERIDVQPVEGAEAEGGGFRFVLAAPGTASWTVTCRRGEFRWLSIAEAGADEANDTRADGIACELRASGEADPWRLALRFSSRELLHTTMPSIADAAEGALARGGAGIRVHTSWKIRGFSIGSGFPTGFLFSRGEAWLAAVDAHGAGGLRLAASLGDEERAAIVAASAALTVYVLRLVEESTSRFGD